MAARNTTRKTATKRTTTGRGRGGGGGGQQMQGFQFGAGGKQIINGWNKLNKQLLTLLDNHRTYGEKLQPFAKHLGIEMEMQGGSGQKQTRSTRKTGTRTTTARSTRARTGRNTQQQNELQSASA